MCIKESFICFLIMYFFLIQTFQIRNFVQMLYLFCIFFFLLPYIINILYVIHEKRIHQYKYLYGYTYTIVPNCKLAHHPEYFYFFITLFHNLMFQNPKYKTSVVFNKTRNKNTKSINNVTIT